MKTLLSKGRQRAQFELGGEKITLQELSLAEIESLKAETNEVNLSLRLILASVVNDDGTKVYAETDLDALRGAISANTLKALGDAITKLNGFEKKAAADPKA